MEAPPSTGSTAEQLPKATSSPRNDQDSLPRKKDVSEGATADAPIPDTSTPENPSSHPLPSLDQSSSDIFRGTSMLFPIRPTNPNIIHKVISSLLYPTIFKALYEKALESDLVGVTRVLAGVTQGWDTNQSLTIRTICVQIILLLVFWLTGVKLGNAVWNMAYFGFASASASLVLMIVLGSKIRDPLFYVGVWGFQEFAVFSFLVALPYWLRRVTVFSGAYLLWTVCRDLFGIGLVVSLLIVSLYII